MIKLDGAADFPEAVSAIARAGIPVFAQFGITPQTALQYGISYGDISKPDAQVPAVMTAQFVEEATRLEGAGASLWGRTEEAGSRASGETCGGAGG